MVIYSTCPLLLHMLYLLLVVIISEYECSQAFVYNLAAA